MTPKDRIRGTKMRTCGVYRKVIACDPSGTSDVYDVLRAFNVACPATQHAVKKLLRAGDHGVKPRLQDLEEAATAIERAIELEEQP